jgi:serine/threonine protein kinase
MDSSLAINRERPVLDRPPAGIVPMQAEVMGDLPRISGHTLLKCVGRGAYGEVWLASDVIGSFHAVKIIYRRSFANDAPFEREFRGIQRFTPVSRTHPGFVHILHVERDDHAGYFFYVMEAGDDETSGQQISPSSYSPKNLSRELARRGRLPLEECLSLSLRLALALDHLHGHQLIHRDIKPANIIFVNGVPKLADIGLVTNLRQDGQETTFVGTDGYIAPEGPGSAGADVYSLGKVIYEAAMGRSRTQYPELPTTLAAHSEAVGAWLDLNEIILKACANEPHERYQTAAELHADLTRLERQLGPPVHVPDDR